MDTRTGEIAAFEKLTKDVTDGEIREFIKPIDIANLSPRLRESYEKTGRAQLVPRSKCPCGSRKRFKSCCMKREVMPMR